jgi:MFS family permease
VSLLLVGYLGPAIGWRNCFYALGVVGLGLALLMLLMRETPRRHLRHAGALTQQHSPERRDSPERRHSPERSQSFRAILAMLFASLRNCPALGLTIAGGVALHFILGAATFEQLWFVQERGFERAEIARTTGWIAMSAGVLGNLFGGIGADKFMRRTGLGRPMFLFWIMLLLAPINVAYRLVPADTLWFWLGVFIGYFQLGCFYGPTFATVQELVPPQIRATVVAFYLLTLNLVGLGFGITAGGILIDALLARGVAEPYTWALLGFSVLSLLAIPLFFAAGRRYEGDRRRLFERASAEVAK